MRSAILGISAYYHDSGVALVSNEGEILYATHEERFSRIKFDPSFPDNSLKEAIKFAQTNGFIIEAIAYYEKPWIKKTRQYSNLAYMLARGNFRKFKFFLKKIIGTDEVADLRRALSKYACLAGKKINFIEHHESHASSVFFTSGLSKSITLVIDGVGEWNATSVWLGEEGSLKKVWARNFPHSIGLAYSAFTQLCGFKVNSGEYKLMGLAPYGEPIYADLILEKVIYRKPYPHFYALNLDFFGFLSGESMANDRLLKLFGLNSFLDDERQLTKIHLDIAASIQKVLEEIISDITLYFIDKYKINNLCLAGGVALNCVMNSKLGSLEEVHEIFLQPACGDAGGALGAALSLSKKSPNFKNTRIHDPCLGNSYELDDVRTSLEASKNISFEYYADRNQYLHEVTSLLIDGNVGGWFSGRSEFGPRSLGARSIIAIPSGSDVQKRINLKIKYRESFRPFAPAALVEDAFDLFEMNFKSPFMLRTVYSKNNTSPGPIMEGQINEKVILNHLSKNKHRLASVIHVDNSARIQTVENRDSLFYKLLQAIKGRVGVSICINTSFNVRGEPIVETPDDAINCFLGTDLDFLAIEGFIAKKIVKIDSELSYAHVLPKD